MNNKVLIFVTRYLCYASNEAFAESIASSLKSAGIEVEICNIINDDSADLALTEYIGKEYLAVIDFNSTIPRAMVGNQRFIDLLDAPFFNYIVDHPLYHHPILSIPLKNYYVICIDKEHVSYIKKHYPKIKDVFFLPLPGSKASNNIPFKDKKDTLLFSGTYYDIAKYEGMIASLDWGKKRLIYDVVDVMKADKTISCDKAYDIVNNRAQMMKSDVSISYGDESDLMSYPGIINSIYLADIYVRALDRKRVIDSLIDAKVELTVLGNEWDKYERVDEVSLISGLDYYKSVNLIASCKYLLNVLPGFTNGSHDRIITGMLNGVAVVTDSNTYLNEIFNEGELLEYSISNIEEDAYMIREMLNNKSLMEEVAEKGRNKCVDMFTFDKHAEKLIYILTHL